MRRVLFLAVLVPALAAAAPGEPDMRFDTTTCYTWEGGLGAQGSYTRCNPVIVQAPAVETVRIVEVPRVEREVIREVVPAPCPPAVQAPKPRPRAQARPPMRCERWVPR